MDATKISVKCTSCGTKYSIPESYQARKIQCRRCGRFIFLKNEGSGVRRVTAPRPAPSATAGQEPVASRRPRKFPVVPLVTVLVSLVAIVVLLKLFILS